MKTHILPIICFKDVIKKADEKDYDIFAGTAPCFYDVNNNTLHSPLNSETLELDHVNQVTFNPSAGTYLIRTINSDNKSVKRTITIKKRIKCELLDSDITKDAEFIKSIIKASYENKLILLDGCLCTYSDKKGTLTRQHDKKVFKLSEFTECHYYPKTNTLKLDYYFRTITLQFVLDYTGNVLSDNM